MATLILTTVGTLVGGPVGGAVGALLGQAVDSRLFAPKARQGPRLGDLSVQTSTYGSEIPKLFGTLRVAGTVIWATDLKETRSTGGGGKGQAKTVNYSYSASFAVALSGRPILGVRRIWADGKLLRGVAGDFKAATGFRLHPGSEDQAPDPLIAAIEGATGTPAYRGLAYAVFEDLQLADYGNRIPSLTFEVDADPGAVSVAAIAADLAGGGVEAGEAESVSGYAAVGDSVRAALETLADIVPLSLLDIGTGLHVGAQGRGTPLDVAEGDTGAAAAGTGGRAQWRRKAAAAIAAETTLAYYDPSRDYQTGLQRSARGGGGARGERRAVAAALPADQAKRLAQARLDALWAGRDTGTIHLAPRWLGLSPGAVVRPAERSGLWRVARLTLEKMVIAAELERLPATLPGTVGAAAGRAVAQPDLAPAPTRLVLLDLPALRDPPPARPQLTIAAAGAPGWRAAPLSASYDGGASWEAAGTTAPAAVIGVVAAAPEGGGSALFDAGGSLEVELLDDGMWIESRSDPALAAGANLAAVGDELLQFGVVEPLGPRRFRLSRLLRGRRGTEWAAEGHAAGEPFVLLEASSLTAVDPPLQALGTQVRVKAHGLADPAEQPPALRLFHAEALRPPAPVHLKAERRDDGAIGVSWVRRSRSGWSWLSGTDTPLGEEREAYRLALAGAAAGGRTVELETGFYLYTADQQAADGIVGPLHVSVSQIGTAAASRETAITIS
jgi:hypothetical protein